MQSRLHIFPSSQHISIKFLLMRFAFMVASNGLWYMLTNNSDMDCPSLQPLSRVPGPSHKHGFRFTIQKWPAQSLVIPSWQPNLTYILGLKTVMVAKVSWGAPACSMDSRKKGSHGRWQSACVTVYNFITIIFICCAGWYSSKIFTSKRKHYFTRFVLYMVKGHHLYLRSLPPSVCNFRWFNIKVAMAH